MILRNIIHIKRIYKTQHIVQTRNFVNSVDGSFTEYCTKNLIDLHQWLQVPWCLEIALVTVAFRACVTFPLIINQKKIFQRLHALNPEIEVISNQLKKKAQDQGYLMGKNNQSINKTYNKAIRKEINRLIQRDNCHPFKAAILPFFQIPIWFVLSRSYRNLSNMHSDPTNSSAILAYEQLSHEGTLWFTNLTIPDPTGILPIASGIINLLNIQVHVKERERLGYHENFFMKFFTNGSRIVSLAVIPIGFIMPSSMTLYWFISAAWGLGQNLALNNPQFKEFFQLKDLEKSGKNK